MSASPERLEAAYSGRLGRFALDARLEAPMHGVTALFGPSGSGKTTLLRCIAGLTRLRGRLVVAGDVWEDAASGIFRAPHARAVGYVFQEASLFPHLSVRKNLLYGQRRASRVCGSAELGFDDVVTLLGIAPLIDRAPGALSGGERQRVAVGRALLSQPRVLLMDEPLSALDQITKEEIFPYLERLQRSLSIPVLYVSHDVAEVQRLADHVVLLDAGKVVSSGPLDDALSDPRLPFARGATAATVLRAGVASFDAADALTTLRVEGGALLVPGRVGAPGSLHRLRIAAGDVSLALDPPSRTTILNVLPARIREIEPLEDGRANVLLGLGDDGRGARLLARVTQRSVRMLKLAAGQSLYVQVKAVSILDGRRALETDTTPQRA